MYQWDGKRYNALFNGVPGAWGPLSSVSLSSNGKAVAVGSPYDAWKGGSTKVYNFHRRLRAMILLKYHFTFLSLQILIQRRRAGNCELIHKSRGGVTLFRVSSTLRL